MSIAEKLQTIAENELKVYNKGVLDGSVKGRIEIEITSNITNSLQLRNTIFNNLDTTHAYCAILTKAKNGAIVNNQVVFLYTLRVSGGEYALRFRDGKYVAIKFTDEYDTGVTIGDIYTVFDLGEVQYGTY
jgi:hypothetical protein